PDRVGARLRGLVAGPARGLNAGPGCYERRRARVRAALRAAALRARGPRDLALARAWRSSDFLDAAPRPSRFRACRTARERFGEGVRPRPARPRAESRAAWRRVSAETLPALGLPSLTPARRAFESPIAIACLVERAPCLPSRTWWISSRTNSPACVEGDLPSSLSRSARSNVSCSGICDSLPATSAVC